MGTNYYLYTEICKHCGRSDDPIHIGKSSVGWHFSFRGYLDDWYDFQITTFEEWKKFLVEKISRGAIIKDEYGREIQLMDFLTLIANKQNSKYKSPALASMASRYSTYRQDWVDDDGYSFSNYEFS